RLAQCIRISHAPAERRRARARIRRAGCEMALGGFMWRFLTPVHEKKAPIEAKAAVAFFAPISEPGGSIFLHRPNAHARLAGIAADDGTDCHSTWSRAG